MFGAPWILRTIPSVSDPVAQRAIAFGLILSPLILCAVVVQAIEARAGRPERIGALAGISLGLTVGLVAFALACASAALLGGLEVDRPGVLPAGLVGWAAAVLLALFQVFGEELFFRGWLQPLLAARCGPWIGLAVGAAIFAATHALVSPPGPLALFNIFLAGALFGVLALRTGSLWAPIAAHWAWNAAETSGVGLTPNPGADALGSLWDLDLGGPAWLGGGVDELNGSMTVTLVMLAAIALCAWLGGPSRGSTAGARQYGRAQR